MPVFGLVVLFITYLSLMIGEPLPKKVALRNAESIAGVMAGAMHPPCHRM